MKSYMSLYEDCDRLPEYRESCYKFLIEGFSGTFGYLIPATVQSFSWGKHWEIDHD
ncbi:uncharacterized protein LY89DRAFT_738189 [Mollisia scopiformis]|uniref:Uncharacterized protein n=1 Tax=Mollisia scopiformis TaxID=149040 RepID=A0A194WXJ2_MOLSC|nr:uncharacterized protein LY89DRAFT_738189 [Mollisia scopiformis]KUJ12399.1 hypothetical protein LY89DRAFT_738189 [Mollisia scopiformis]